MQEFMFSNRSLNKIPDTRTYDLDEAAKSTEDDRSINLMCIEEEEEETKQGRCGLSKEKDRF